MEETHDHKTFYIIVLAALLIAATVISSFLYISRKNIVAEKVTADSTNLTLKSKNTDLADSVDFKNRQLTNANTNLQNEKGKIEYRTDIKYISKGLDDERNRIRSQSAIDKANQGAKYLTDTTDFESEIDSSLEIPR